MELITPFLAVGSKADALDDQQLARLNIRALLSLANLPRPESVWCQLQLDIADRQPIPVDKIRQAMLFIDDQIRQGRRVLLHCEMGISRSPALAASYLHQFEGVSLAQAIEHVRRIRPIAAPHPALIDSLQTFHRQRLTERCA